MVWGPIWFSDLDPTPLETTPDIYFFLSVARTGFIFLFLERRHMSLTELHPGYPIRLVSSNSFFESGSFAEVVFVHCSSSSILAAFSRNSGAAHFFTSKSFLM